MVTKLLLADSDQQHSSQADGFSAAQSLALMKIFVNASIANICYARELLPYHSNCFQSRFMNDLEDWQRESDQYERFRDLETSLKFGRSQEFKILTHSENAHGNQILKLLELGVFDAVEQGHLDAVQFFLVRDIKDPTTLLETYVFNFSYSAATGTARHLSSVTFNSSKESVVVDALKSFRKAIKTLLLGLHNLSRLPKHKSLGMSIIYNSSCPNHYQPPGFHDAATYAEEMGTDWCGLWQVRHKSFAVLDTAHHRTVLASDQADNFPPAEHMTTPDAEDVEIRRQMREMLKPSSQPTDLVPTQVTQPHPKRQISMLRDTSNGRYIPSSRVMESPLEVVQASAGDVAKPSMKRTTGRPTDLMTPEPVARVFVSPSSKPSPTSSHSALLPSIRNRRQRNLKPVKLAELVVHACAMENDNQSTAYKFDPDELDKAKIIRCSPVTEVRCDCGDSQEDAKMLTCHLCGTLQHIACYGLHGMYSNRFPAEHFCYSCLLLPKEESTCHQMTSIVRTRLIVSHLLSSPDSKAPVDDAFMSAVRLSFTDPASKLVLRDTLQDVQARGYILGNVKEEVALPRHKKEEVQKRYQDHLALIGHHYEAVKDGVSTEGRQQYIQLAVQSYAGERQYRVGIQATYDAIEATDAFGKTITRWGYYARDGGRKHDVENATSKRKAKLPDTPESKRPCTRRLSLGDFVSLGRSSPSSVEA